MELKIIASIISVIFGTISFIPYLKDIFSKKTQPHLYTWLIWTLTQGTATVALWYGNGGLGGLNLTIGTFLILCVCFFSIKHGTKNITIHDTIILFISILAIIIWWQLKQPVLSIILVSVIDLLGYIPTYRKSYMHPWSENLLAWIGFSMGNIFAIAALDEYNFLTLTYLVFIVIGNTIFSFFIFIRRFYLKNDRAVV
jgi:hypothetical protein